MAVVVPTPTLLAAPPVGGVVQLSNVPFQPRYWPLVVGAVTAVTVDDELVASTILAVENDVKPVPPFATVIVPKLILGVIPPEELKGALAVTEVTVPPPLASKSLLVAPV